MTVGVWGFGQGFGFGQQHELNEVVQPLMGFILVWKRTYRRAFPCRKKPLALGRKKPISSNRYIAACLAGSVDSRHTITTCTIWRLDKSMDILYFSVILNLLKRFVTSVYKRKGHFTNLLLTGISLAIFLCRKLGLFGQFFVALGPGQC